MSRGPKLALALETEVVQVSKKSVSPSVVLFVNWLVLSH